MEFRYRAGDERSRSSPPPPPPATASSGSARVLPANEDAGKGDYHGGNSAVSPGQSSSPSAAAVAGRDELRQAKKQKIMERILLEEAEEWELESEVRREIMERIFPLLRRSGNAQPAAALLKSTQVAVTNANTSASSASLPAKRKKNPAAAAAASAFSAATSSKKPKAADLTCAVCGITSTGEKAMQDHLNGKSHKKKAGALALSSPPPPEPKPEEDAAAMMPPALDGSGGFNPTKLSMLTSAGVVYEVMQMDGYLLCEGCNVRTADRVTMMCHLDGGKHISKATKLKQQQARKPPAPATATASPMNGVKAAAAATTEAAADGEEHGTVVVEVDGEPHAVRRLDEVFILCDVCNVKAPSVTVMRSHLAGRKHKSMAAVTAKAKAEAAAGKVGGNLEAGAMAVVENVATNVADTCPEKGTVDIVVGGEHHAVMQIGEFLGCTSCNVRATSESDMRLHLAGKKHNIKSMAEKAAMDEEFLKARSKQTATASPLSAPRAVVAEQTGDGSIAPNPMEVNQTAKTRDGGAPVTAAANGDERVAADANSTAVAAAAAATGQQQVKIQVEGRMLAVLRQANGALLCEPCGVRCSGKTDMMLHLYTREHWDKCGTHPPT
uniref:C2H2-type domain-containing protein n=1 Tax=Oryza punctata TaxID=4537 RepID=A0A0E0LT40_ORYPU